MSGNLLNPCAHAAYLRISQVMRMPWHTDTAPSDCASLAAMEGLENHLGLAAAVELCGLQVVDERRLGAGTGLGDQVTELVLILGDAAVKSVVLPVTVEDVAGVKLVMEE